jgi:hypothetical protein
MDTAGFFFLANQQQSPAPVAHDSVPHWHAVIMLRRSEQVECGIDKSPYHSLTAQKGEWKARSSDMAFFDSQVPVCPL